MVISSQTLIAIVATNYGRKHCGHTTASCRSNDQQALYGYQQVRSHRMWSLADLRNLELLEKIYKILMKCTTRATFIVIEFADDKNTGDDARAGHARVVYMHMRSLRAHSVDTCDQEVRENQLHYRNDAGNLWVRILFWKSLLLTRFQSSRLDDQLIHFWCWQGRIGTFYFCSQL